jgi:hypothetical protein
MAAFYGTRWTGSFGEDPYDVEGDTWAAGLGDLSPEQLATGLRGCMRSADGWPPSMQEFRALCFALPTFGEVVRQLRPGSPEASPFVRLIWTMLDGYALRNADARTERQMMKEAYESAVQRVMSGEPLPQAHLQIGYDADAERRAYDEIHFARYNEFRNVADDGNPS